jgi:hypothetical protein
MQNMESFIKKNVQQIKEMIINNHKVNEFREFAGKYTRCKKETLII